MIVDDFSRFTWILFLDQKNKAFSIFTKFCQKISNEKNLIVICIRSDYETKFENQYFEKFYKEKGIEHNFFASKHLIKWDC